MCARLCVFHLQKTKAHPELITDPSNPSNDGLMHSDLTRDNWHRQKKNNIADICISTIPWVWLTHLNWSQKMSNINSCFFALASSSYFSCLFWSLWMDRPHKISPTSFGFTLQRAHRASMRTRGRKTLKTQGAGGQRDFSAPPHLNSLSGVEGFKSGPKTNIFFSLAFNAAWVLWSSIVVVEVFFFSHFLNRCGCKARYFGTILFLKCAI